jgi:hypothetical protein
LWRKSVATQTRNFWHDYLEKTTTYGTFEQRCPEYQIVFNYLKSLGLEDDDLIVDVGAGSCDMDHFLRTRGGWRGKFLPIDGATYGIDFNNVHPDDYLPDADAHWYVCIETLEHVYDPEALILSMQARATKGVIVTTPNADVVDVVAVDSTHVMPIHPQDLQAWGFSVIKVNLNQRDEHDTLVGIWRPDAEDYPAG